jgi:hypothetical protein
MAKICVAGKILQNSHLQALHVVVLFERKAIHGMYQDVIAVRRIRSIVETPFLLSGRLNEVAVHNDWDSFHDSVWMFSFIPIVSSWGLQPIAQAYYFEVA